MTSNEGHLCCANCDGTGYVVDGWRDQKCGDCDGWGVLLDIDSYELPVTSIRPLLRLIAIMTMGQILVSPLAHATWDDAAWLFHTMGVA